MNMREKMARAIAAEVAAPWDNLYENKADWTDDRGKRGDVNGPFREDCFNAVDSILVAMREPTREVRYVGEEVNEYEAGDSQTGWYGGTIDPTPAWQAMIDAIKAGK